MVGRLLGLVGAGAVFAGATRDEPDVARVETRRTTRTGAERVRECGCDLKDSRQISVLLFAVKDYL